MQHNKCRSEVLFCSFSPDYIGLKTLYKRESGLIPILFLQAEAGAN